MPITWPRLAISAITPTVAINTGPRSMGSRAEFARTLPLVLERWTPPSTPGRRAAGTIASIVSGTTEAGFGYAISPNGGTYWVGVYGSPAEGDGAGEEEGHAEAEAARLKAEAEKARLKAKTTVAKPEIKVEADPKAETAPKTEKPAEKTPAAAGK